MLINVLLLQLAACEWRNAAVLIWDEIKYLASSGISSSSSLESWLNTVASFDLAAGLTFPRFSFRDPPPAFTAFGGWTLGIAAVGLNLLVTDSFTIGSEGGFEGKPPLIDGDMPKGGGGKEWGRGGSEPKGGGAERKGGGGGTEHKEGGGAEQKGGGGIPPPIKPGGGGGTLSPPCCSDLYGGLFLSSFLLLPPLLLLLLLPWELRSLERLRPPPCEDRRRRLLLDDRERERRWLVLLRLSRLRLLLLELLLLDELLRLNLGITLGKTLIINNIFNIGHEKYLFLVKKEVRWSSKFDIESKIW